MYDDELRAIVRKLFKTDIEKGAIDLSDVESIGSSDINFGIYTTIDYMFKISLLEKLDKIAEGLKNIK